MMRLTGHVTLTRDDKYVKRPLVRRRRRWEDDKLNFKEMEWERVDWIDLAQDGLVNSIMNLRVP
jgi:hypothetical protein